MLKTGGKYLITGGTGFLGHALVERLLKDGYENLTVLGRSEKGLVETREKYPVKIVSGNIADPMTCEKVCDVDGIFHLAAMKHVGLAEQHSTECIKSNVIGTLNLLEETRKRGIDFIIGISTDKAAQVNGVYGATKLLMERLFAEYETFNEETEYRIVRYGNVLYSTGSVLCKWKDKMQKGEKVIITDPDATRFYWTVDQAIDLIFDSFKAKDSDPYITTMKAMRLGDLLDAMMEKYGRVGVETIGLQPGENKHEKLDAVTSSDKVEKYTKEEILELI